MNSIINLSIGGTYLILLVFGLFMLVVTYLFARWQKFSSVEGFLVGRRQVHWFLGGSSIAACVAVPTVLSLYWDRLNPKGVFWGVAVAFFVGLPVFIYSNFIANNTMTVLSSLGIIAVTTVCCLAMPKKMKTAHSSL